MVHDLIEIPQKPKEGSLIVLWWIRKLWMGAKATCPRCERGSMFEGPFQIRKRCPHCDVLLQPYCGDELGVIAVGYVLTLIPALLGLFAAYHYTDWSAYQLLALFVTISGAVLVGFFRNMKGVWVAFVYLMTGFRGP